MILSDYSMRYDSWNRQCQACAEHSISGWQWKDSCFAIKGEPKKTESQNDTKLYTQRIKILSLETGFGDARRHKKDLDCRFIPDPALSLIYIGTVKRESESNYLCLPFFAHPQSWVTTSQLKDLKALGIYSIWPCHPINGHIILNTFVNYK